MSCFPVLFRFVIVTSATISLFSPQRVKFKIVITKNAFLREQDKAMFNLSEGSSFRKDKWTTEQLLIPRSYRYKKKKHTHKNTTFPTLALVPLTLYDLPRHSAVQPVTSLRHKDKVSLGSPSRLSPTTSRQVLNPRLSRPSFKSDHSSRGVSLGHVATCLLPTRR